MRHHTIYLNSSFEKHDLNSKKSGLADKIDSLIMAKGICDSKEWMCTICGKVTVEKSHIAQHIETNHIEGVLHPCNMCGNLSRNRNALDTHMLKHHGHNNHFQNQGNPNSNSETIRELNKKIASIITVGPNVIERTDGLRKDRSYVCRLCQKEGTQTNIIDHIEAHHVAGLVLHCDFCDKAFKSRQALRCHKSRQRGGMRSCRGASLVDSN